MVGGQRKREAVSMTGTLGRAESCRILLSREFYYKDESSPLKRYGKEAQSLLFEVTLSDAEDVYKPRSKITKQTHEAIQCFTLHCGLQYTCLEHSASPSVLLKLNLLLIRWSIKAT